MPAIELNKLAPALKPMRNTLQSLTISAFDCKSMVFLGYEELKVTGNLNSLASFNLRRLQIPLTFVLGRSNKYGDSSVVGCADDNSESFVLDQFEHNDQDFVLSRSIDPGARLETCIPPTVEEVIFTLELSTRKDLSWSCQEILYLFKMRFRMGDFSERWPDLSLVRLKVGFVGYEWVEDKIRKLESLASSVGFRSEVAKAEHWHSCP
ncbi:hypothetical protein ACHAPJ_011857 [Fusarium lateritium]